jgi:hypothetical protein
MAVRHVYVSLLGSYGWRVAQVVGAGLDTDPVSAYQPLILFVGMAFVPAAFELPAGSRILSCRDRWDDLHSSLEVHKARRLYFRPVPVL